MRDFRSSFYIFGILLCIESFAMLIPMFVDLFYSNVGLTTPVTPNANEFRTFQTDTATNEPFDQIKVSAKFGTDGVKIVPSVSEKICNSGAYAVACQSGFSTCAQPMPGATGWV